MKALPILAAAAIALSACTTTGTSDIDVAVQKSLPQACKALETAHIAFTAVAVSGSINASTVRKEAAAYAGVATICTDPGNTTAIGAAILVAQAYLVVSTSLKNAKDAE